MENKKHWRPHFPKLPNSILYLYIPVGLILLNAELKNHPSPPWVITEILLIAGCSLFALLDQLNLIVVTPAAIPDPVEPADVFVVRWDNDEGREDHESAIVAACSSVDAAIRYLCQHPDLEVDTLHIRDFVIPPTAPELSWVRNWFWTWSTREGIVPARTITWTISQYEVQK